MQCCPAKKKRLSGNNLAALWGLFEAIFFFIVPDVIISYIALKDYKKSITACFYVMFGALMGGVIVYVLSYHYNTQAKELLDAIPGISPALISRADTLISHDLFYGMLAGSFTGVPYKIFGVLAGNSGAPLHVFLLASIPARLARFFVVSSLTALIAQVVLKNRNYRTKLRILCGVWLVFYIFYFYAMGW